MWMDRIPDRVEIRQSLGHRPDLRMYRPYITYLLFRISGHRKILAIQK